MDHIRGAVFLCADMKRARETAKTKTAKETPTTATRRATSARHGRRGEKPIELYYWPTPNGWKISIMLEECGLPYVVRPVDISKGEQFTAGFLAISPNNRMPAIVDPAGPGGQPISVFESGAILQYLGCKAGKFYPREERARVAVEEWLYWQVGGLGPMAGQAVHFRRYAPQEIFYAIARYTDEVNRLYGVMNTRLAQHEFLAGRYSIADMAAVGWVRLAERQGQNLDDFPHLKRWFETIRARPAVKRAFAIRVEAASAVDMRDAKVRAVLFGQRAR
ncbi:MAG: glutathione binding-like protein [Xanthobacteraceae bacterium]